MNKNGARKPFGDLTNKFLSVSLSDGIKPRPPRKSSDSQISHGSKGDDEVHLQYPDSSGQSSSSQDMVSNERQEELDETRAVARLNLSGASSEARSLETSTEGSEATTSSTSSSLSSKASPFFPNNSFYQEASISPVFLYPPPPPSLPHVQELLALVMEPGFISLRLSHGVLLDIANDLSVRLENPWQQSSIAMSGDSHHVAVIHPRARSLLYQPRAEVQLEDRLSLKNAKFYSKGISFTASNLALVYLLDEAGARTTSDTFHDLLGTNIVEVLFRDRCASQNSSVSGSCQQLDRIRFWRNQVTLLLFGLSGLNCDLFC